eukprot:TRINITY_DN4690_c0_g1_i1.p1 TRINITY_DN4690_c0_g1~~TRINITY_DN4690_c0_g1_i1.p1  ORF type:complete len:619 (-),score=191.42 TRINITY_DN4690_c0_g1_i1:211-2067(-)
MDDIGEEIPPRSPFSPARYLQQNLTALENVFHPEDGSPTALHSADPMYAHFLQQFNDLYSHLREWRSLAPSVGGETWVSITRVVLDWLEEHPDASASVMLSVLEALGKVANVPENRLMLVNEGALRFIVDKLVSVLEFSRAKDDASEQGRTFSVSQDELDEPEDLGQYDSELVSACLQTLSNLLVREEVIETVSRREKSMLEGYATYGPEQIYNRPIISTLLELTQRYMSSKAVARYSTAVVRNIVLNGFLRDAFAERGGIFLLMSVMREYPRDLELQQHGCAAAWNIGLTNIRYKMQLLQCDVMKNLLSALRNFPGVLRIQRNACGCLANVLSWMGSDEWGARHALQLSRLESFRKTGARRSVCSEEEGPEDAQHVVNVVPENVEFGMKMWKREGDIEEILDRCAPNSRGAVDTIRVVRSRWLSVQQEEGKELEEEKEGEKELEEEEKLDMVPKSVEKVGNGAEEEEKREENGEEKSTVIEPVHQDHEETEVLDLSAEDEIATGRDHDSPQADDEMEREESDREEMFQKGMEEAEPEIVFDEDDDKIVDDLMNEDDAEECASPVHAPLVGSDDIPLSGETGLERSPSSTQDSLRITGERNADSDVGSADESNEMGHD